mmetsp:Transcript_51521/g.167173  ORF Transcript_51521/g.167173 Transcript_51521/m.167173 type:complete len:1012 (+) Transcript_51521:87-3122(+)
MSAGLPDSGAGDEGAPVASQDAGGAGGAQDVHEQQKPESALLASTPGERMTAQAEIFCAADLSARKSCGMQCRLTMEVRERVNELDICPIAMETMVDPVRVVHEDEASRGSGAVPHVLSRSAAERWLLQDPGKRCPLCRSPVLRLESDDATEETLHGLITSLARERFYAGDNLAHKAVKLLDTKLFAAICRFLPMETAHDMLLQGNDDNITPLGLLESMHAPSQAKAFLQGLPQRNESGGAPKLLYSPKSAVHGGSQIWCHEQPVFEGSLIHGRDGSVYVTFYVAEVPNANGRRTNAGLDQHAGAADVYATIPSTSNARGQAGTSRRPDGSGLDQRTGFAERVPGNRPLGATLPGMGVGVRAQDDGASVADSVHGQALAHGSSSASDGAERIDGDMLGREGRSIAGGPMVTNTSSGEAGVAWDAPSAHASGQDRQGFDSISQVSTFSRHGADGGSPPTSRAGNGAVPGQVSRRAATILEGAEESTSNEERLGGELGRSFRGSDEAGDGQERRGRGQQVPSPQVRREQPHAVLATATSVPGAHERSQLRRPLEAFAPADRRPLEAVANSRNFAPRDVGPFDPALEEYLRIRLAGRSQLANPVRGPFLWGGAVLLRSWYEKQTRKSEVCVCPVMHFQVPRWDNEFDEEVFEPVICVSRGATPPKVFHGRTAARRGIWIGGIAHFDDFVVPGEPGAAALIIFDPEKSQWRLYGGASTEISIWACSEGAAPQPSGPSAATQGRYLVPTPWAGASASGPAEEVATAVGEEGIELNKLVMANVRLSPASSVTLTLEPVFVARRWSEIAGSMMPRAAPSLAQARRMRERVVLMVLRTSYGHATVIQLGAVLTDFIIGRGEACNLRFPDALSVSRSHCALTLREEGGSKPWLAVYDEGSLSGTQLQDKALGVGPQNAEPILQGDVLRLGAEVTVKIEAVSSVLRLDDSDGLAAFFEEVGETDTAQTLRQEPRVSEAIVSFSLTAGPSSSRWSASSGNRDSQPFDDFPGASFNNFNSDDF